MEIAKVTSKGQITIPISIRKVLQLNPGDKVVMEEENGKIVMVNADKHLNLSSLVFSSKHPSSSESLKDETPFEWSEDVLSEKRKATL